jgi:hypothetical protein
MLDGRSSTNQQRPGRCAGQVLPEPDLLHFKNRHVHVVRTRVGDAFRRQNVCRSDRFGRIAITRYLNRRNANES